PHVVALLFVLLILFTATLPTETYPLSLHDALPISRASLSKMQPLVDVSPQPNVIFPAVQYRLNDPSSAQITAVEIKGKILRPLLDRKSTRLNSSRVKISYAVFCLKKKTLIYDMTRW